ncbi:hypothetical protein C9J48_23955 [Photobacterium profundum]|uniref:Uncharacterized protein n=1 Tax=Photobacterium profundum 3TCK TaxID=314280 RepID=Q1Z9G4_9GAMM|nr:hypothetical protein [Photobacterium profundum]EAS44794.1 hypothetical protein P3TCK_19960 [Photobacterium profundum 3TCK]PSV59315.1 hypothetical protein C9J48_23955 [Photobacterium profundum]
MNRRSKTRLVSSIAIFISGYTPLFLIMIIKDIKDFVWYEKTLETPFFWVSNIKIPYWVTVTNSDVVITLIILSIISLLLLGYVLGNITKDPFDITVISAKCRSSEVVNYTIPYMISFVAFDLSKWQDIFSLALFLSVLCLLSIRSQSVFINPILAAIGYGLYDCSYNEGDQVKECVMLSRNDLLANTKEKFVKLNNYMGIISK